MIRIDLLNDDKCIACGRCIQACHNNAIEFCTGNYGNIHPTINREFCDSCGKCQRECERINLPKTNNKKSEDVFYIGKTNDKKEIINSASGGIFFEFAKLFVELYDGVIYGATYDPSKKAITIKRGTTIADIRKMRKSKYAQSIWTYSREDLDKDVRSGRKVLVSGLPCQIVAIKEQYKGFDNVCYIDLFCHGVIGHRYFRDFMSKQNPKIDTVDFRDDGWSNFKLTLKENEDICFSRENEECLFYMLFIYGANIKRVCMECPFSSEKHVADITLGDFSDEKIANECGYSVKHLSAISINSENGKRIFEKIKDKISFERITDQRIIESYYPDHTKQIGAWGYNRDLWEIFCKKFNETHDIDSAGIYVFQREYDFLRRIVQMGIENIYIYGTGEVAKIVNMLIYEFFPSINVLAFLRTFAQNEEQFLGKQVYQLDKAPEVKDDSWIVVCVKDEYKKEIESILINNYVKRYMIL